MAYFRVTVYHPAEDVSAIIDSNGYFEKLWQLSAALVQKGFRILEVGSDDRFLEGDFPKTEADSQHLLLRACKTGMPDYTNGSVQIGGRNYPPQRIRKCNITDRSTLCYGIQPVPCPNGQGTYFYSSTVLDSIFFLMSAIACEYPTL